MTESDIQWWKRIRARGKRWFVLREGLMRYGVRVGSTVTIFSAMFQFFLGADFKASLWILLIVFGFTTLLPGVLIGLVLWKQHETDYRNYANEVDIRTS
jgi:hypothetical protein